MRGDDEEMVGWVSVLAHWCAADWVYYSTLDATLGGGSRHGFW